jgi:hypothetical protein
MLYRTDISTGTAGEYKYLIVNIDESNARLCGGLPATAANRAGKEFATGEDYLRIEYRKLYLQGENADGKTVRRSIIACDPDDDLYSNGGTVNLGFMTDDDSLEVVACSVTGVVGEKRTLPFEGDSGLDDGTPAE